jgi:SPP1 family predicted phage head-tail adaptor
MIEAGKLDRRIRVQRATVIIDDLGSEVPAWADLRETWASVEWVRDSERFRAAEVSAAVEVRFQIRWGLGVTVRDRVIYDGRVWDISAVKELGRREGQEISAAARAEASL